MSIIELRENVIVEAEPRNDLDSTSTRELTASILSQLAKKGSAATPKQLSQLIITDESLKMPVNDGILKDRIRKILYYESIKEDGKIVRIDRSTYELRERICLREKVLGELKSQGFSLSQNSGIDKAMMADKDTIRNIHAHARMDKYNSMLNIIQKREKEFIENFADGCDVSVDDFYPEFELVKADTRDSELFRYACLLWSVPVSQGFGRRVRFLVRDKYNGKLVGLFALGDPVFNLRCRDGFIGWSSGDREKRLYNVMDIFILGAVPPYNSLLCGKLIALLAASDEVRNVVENRYKDTSTVILGQKKDPRLALLTTGSALGKSSIYDRLKMNGSTIYHLVGVSEGWGHFHLNNGLFERMRDFLTLIEPDAASRNRFGQGPNWKMRTARECLQKLGLSPNILQHGISREIYAVPLATNYKEYLRGEESSLKPISYPYDKIVDYFKERWMVPRAERCPDAFRFDHSEIAQRIRAYGSSPQGGDFT